MIQTVHSGDEGSQNSFLCALVGNEKAIYLNCI